MSSLPFSFSNVIQLLILYSTSFAEWDIDVIPANILFRSPNATLAFGKVAHIFFGRSAIQRYDKQCIKLFYVGGHFFNNQQSQKYWEKQKNSQIQKLNLSYDDSDHQTNSNKSHDDESENQDLDEMSLDYFPNEIKFSDKFTNSELEQILAEKQSPHEDYSYENISELFRAMTLCH